MKDSLSHVFAFGGFTGHLFIKFDVFSLVPGSEPWGCACQGHSTSGLHQQLSFAFCFETFSVGFPGWLSLHDHPASAA